eukprot:c26174_g1_i1 orf=90-2144(+)
MLEKRAEIGRQSVLTPLVFAASFLFVMYIWHYVSSLRYNNEVQHKMSVEAFCQKIGKACRVPGVALVYSELAQGVPAIFSHMVENLPAMQSVVVFVCVKFLPVVTVMDEERFLIRRIGPSSLHTYRCVARYGYKDIRKESDRFEQELLAELARFITSEQQGRSLSSCRLEGKPAVESHARISSGSIHPERQSSHGSESPEPEVKNEEEEEEEKLRLKVADYDALPSIPDAKRVVLVRHGESTWNEEGRIQGSSDYAVLTPKGESQAETSRQMLLFDSFDLCFHSPLARAKRTAEIIWGSRRNPMIPIQDLREIDLYSFQGLMKHEGKERFGEAYRKWQKDAANFMIDGHFPVRELWVRAQNCWGQILSHDGQSAIVVAHNAVNQALVSTATGLGPEYFRQLLQSNCGVSVLDFTPRNSGDGPPFVCLNRLNQTPGPPISGRQSGGRKCRDRIILICHGATDSSSENRFAASEGEPMNMLGVIQSRKTAELLLDVVVDSLICSPQSCAVSTAAAIAEVQEAAHCLGADCFPRYVEVKQVSEFRDMQWGHWKGKAVAEVAHHERWQDFLQHEDIDGGEKLSVLWERAGYAWQTVTENLGKLEKGLDEERNVVVVGHEIVHISMLGHCLGLKTASIGSFRLDTGSLSVIDFPDGPSGKGVVRCLNYTAHLGRWAVPVTRSTMGDEEF